MAPLAWLTSCFGGTGTSKDPDETRGVLEKQRTGSSGAASQARRHPNFKHSAKSLLDAQLGSGTCYYLRGRIPFTKNWDVLQHCQGTEKPGLQHLNAGAASLLSMPGRKYWEDRSQRGGPSVGSPGAGDEEEPVVEDLVEEASVGDCGGCKFWGRGASSTREWFHVPWALAFASCT